MPNLFRHCGGGKFKAQLKKADASGAVAIILGEEEVEKQHSRCKIFAVSARADNC